MNPAHKGDTKAAIVFLAPTFIGFGVLVLGPMVAAFVLSFFKWNLLSSPTFVGLDNYQALIRDVRLAHVYTATATMAIALVIINLVIGLLLAVLIDMRMPGILRSFFRLTYFLPFVISAAAVALIWRFLLNPNLGLVNYVLGLVDITGPNWLGASGWTSVSVVMVAAWKSIGFNVLVFLAGLQGVPREIQEAAAVDGAGRVMTFRKITVPLLTPTIFFLVVINTLIAFQLFAEPLVLTQGGPGDASRTVVQYIFETGLRNFNIGYASTVALSLFVILSVLTAIQFTLSRRWTFYR